MKFTVVALVALSMVVVAAADGHADDFPFPDSIGLCGEGVCKEIPVITNDMGMATGVGPVPATGSLGESGNYPSVISLCGLLTCVTVPVEIEGSDVPVPGMNANGPCPVDIGLCGDGSCKVVPVNTDANGDAVSVGPVMMGGKPGNPGSYPVDVGVCCNGVCKALPVMIRRMPRKMTGL